MSPMPMSFSACLRSAAVASETTMASSLRLEHHVAEEEHRRDDLPERVALLLVGEAAQLAIAESMSTWRTRARR